MQKRCGAKTRSGEPCKNYAMANGRCRMHGGKATGRPIIHGRYSLKHRESLQAKMQQFLDDPQPGELYDELALIRTLLQDYLDRFPDGVPLALSDMKAIVEINESIGRMVERISRILNQTALTQADILYLRAMLVDLIVRYIDEPDRRDAFFDELRLALGPSRRSSARLRN